MTTPTAPTDLIEPRSGISKRALSIAQAIDRLAPGFAYEIELDKPEMPALEWSVVIVRQEKIQVMKLTYQPE